MSGTPNLGLTYLTSGQLQPEVTVNGDLNALDALLPLAASFANNPATTTGLTYGYYGGSLWSGSTATVVASGTVALTASATNYVQLTTAGVVSANTTSFTSGQIPLATVVTGSAGITSIADKRPMTAQNDAPVTLTYASTVTPNAASGTNFELVLAGACTLANPTGLVNGMTLRFCVDQNATGGYALTLGTLYKWPGGTVPTWVTTASAKNFFSAYYDGSVLRCNGGAGYA